MRITNLCMENLMDVIKIYKTLKATIRHLMVAEIGQSV
jgi:hypothetical protein